MSVRSRRIINYVMNKRHHNCRLLLILSAVGFCSAAGVFLVQQFIASGVFESICKTALYVLVAAATLLLSYALFIRASQAHRPRSVPSRG